MKNVLILYEESDLNKNRWFVEKCADVFKKYGLNTRVLTTDDNIKEECEFVINRSRDYKISKYFEEHDIRVFNSAFVTEIGNDKWKTYTFAREHGIDVLDTDLKEMDYPQVVKSRNGHGGSEVFLVKNRQELETILKEDVDNREKKYIYQQLAGTVGTDIRVYVLGEEIVAAVKRQAKDDFRSNFSLGGRTSLYELSKTEREFVQRIISILKPDYVGIDIMYNGNVPVLNEIEDAAGARMLYQNSDIDILEMFAEYCIKSSGFAKM